MVVGWWWLVSRSERPSGEVRAKDFQEEVHNRLHAKDETNADHLPCDLCHSYTINTVVWETLAVLGEWEFIDLVLPKPPEVGNGD
jgi:hypothetical protein